jgi:hypothetical protein
MVHLVGVDHIIQHNGYVDAEEKKAIRDFQKYLGERTTALGASTLAEEFSEDAMRLGCASVATVQEVARKLGIRHLFCDPGKDERSRLGISSNAQREAYWEEKILPFRKEEIIFVCGDDHVAPFSAVLRQHGWKCDVLSEGWGKPLNPTR